MKVFKFGGASVKDAQAVRNVGNILQAYQDEKILMIVSAMGKTTNALERMASGYFYDIPENKEVLNQSIDFHLNICQELFGEQGDCGKEIEKDFLDIPHLIEQHKESGYDLVYDQVVSLGEWASTKIVSTYLNQLGLGTHWLDVIQCVKTDAIHREATVNWEKTEKEIQNSVVPLFESKNFVMTQGFTGQTDDGLITTLGREGSDYSAAIFSYCLDAENMTVWKDVEGILNADPRKFKQVTKLDRISYKEAIEMTYYGAKVIHPKTIKPLQNKSIPLHVKSFLEPSEKGTIISDLSEENYPPIVVVEPEQTLLHISTKDFSFVAEHHLSHLFASFAQQKIKVNMMRNTAISFSVCVTHREKRIQELLEQLQKEFNIEKNEGLELITIRYYTPAIIEQLKQDKIVVMEERIKNTIQMVVKTISIPKQIN